MSRIMLSSSLATAIAGLLLAVVVFFCKTLIDDARVTAVSLNQHRIEEEREIGALRAHDSLMANQVNMLEKKMDNIDNKLDIILKKLNHESP